MAYVCEAGEVVLVLEHACPAYAGALARVVGVRGGRLVLRVLRDDRELTALPEHVLDGEQSMAQERESDDASCPSSCSEGDDEVCAEKPLLVEHAAMALLHAQHGEQAERCLRAGDDPVSAALLCELLLSTGETQLSAKAWSSLQLPSTLTIVVHAYHFGPQTERRRCRRRPGAGQATPR